MNTTSLSATRAGGVWLYLVAHIVLAKINIQSVGWLEMYIYNGFALVERVWAWLVSYVEHEIS